MNVHLHGSVWKTLPPVGDGIFIAGGDVGQILAGAEAVRLRSALCGALPLLDEHPGQDHHHQTTHHGQSTDTQEGSHQLPPAGTLWSCADVKVLLSSLGAGLEAVATAVATDVLALDLSWVT